MIATHSLRVFCRCPVDDSFDVYDTEVTTDRLLPVEAILAAAAKVEAGPAAWQEDVTRWLARELDAHVVTEGVHSGVRTRVEVPNTPVRER